MSKVGEVERATQNHVVKLFVDSLGYEYLGNWEYREDNSCIEETYLRKFILSQGVESALAGKAIYELTKIATNRSVPLYDRNRTIYELLRSGVPVKPSEKESNKHVRLIDWDNPQNNHFAIAEEVTVASQRANGHQKRPDIVLYINGLALGILELKRSTIHASEGIRQNLDNQKDDFISDFMPTVQYLMAGNKTEGLFYGAIGTPEKYYLKWKEDDSSITNPLDRALTQVCNKERFLEFIYNFVAFDSGIKKLCRPNQYFAIKAVQEYVNQGKGGIIWHTQGSGKSIIMVWLAKWIRENVKDSRVLIVTDRDELDKQIEGIFAGVGENDIFRTTSSAEMIEALNNNQKWLICSLVHKFGVATRPSRAGQNNNEDTGDSALSDYIEGLKSNIPKDFLAKGNIFVFIDEAHRTQSGDFHQAMKKILPKAVFFGFTGTPLLNADKKRTVDIFGPYIHTYKYNEAVADGVVLDLVYEARDINQKLTSPDKIDQFFESKTKGLNDIAKTKLKKKWGTMQKVLSSSSRLNTIVADIVLDMNTKPRLSDDSGNALLVASSIHDACRYYDLFAETELKGKVAIITSYTPHVSKIKGETTGDGDTDNIEKYDTYRKMLATWFDTSEDEALRLQDKFEDQAKDRFIKQPARLKLLIVVDKLLTGFDAPSATYLYIDSAMRDHGLFQAICRVNRLDEGKEYGYIVDYKDLFKTLESAVQDYTSGALDGYDPQDVVGLMEDHLDRAKQTLGERRDTVKAIVEPVDPPKGTDEYLAFFISPENSTNEQIKEDEDKRQALYKSISNYTRAYAEVANQMVEAGYSTSEIKDIVSEVEYFEAVKNEVNLASGDNPDLKRFEPNMRHLIDTYIKSDESKKLSSFDDIGFMELFIKTPEGAIDCFPDGIRDSRNGVALVINNNIRRVIVDETPANPKYYEKMSNLLEEIIRDRKRQSLTYGEYLTKMADLAKRSKYPHASDYPAQLDTPGKRALHDNFTQDLSILKLLDHTLQLNAQPGWRNNMMKKRMIKNALLGALSKVGREPSEEELTSLLELVAAQQDEY